MAKPRWFRFSLRTLFVLVTVLALALYYFIEWRVVQERKSIIAEIKSQEPAKYRLNCFCLDLFPPEIASRSEYDYARISPIRRFIGDESYLSIELSFLPTTAAGEASPELMARLEAAFPEARLTIAEYSYPNALEQTISFRESLYIPTDKRLPNRGHLFKTDRVEKPASK